MAEIQNPRFSDVQSILDAILRKSHFGQSHPNGSPPPHRIFWRQTNDYEQDYQRFTTGLVPGVDIPIMNTAAGQALTSNFFVVLTSPDGLPDDGVSQMPDGGPFITDPGYELTLADGRVMTGAETQASLRRWLQSGFPK
jgi:hypothetical protein